MEKCSFCNCDLTNADMLIRSKISRNVFICDKCVEKSYNKSQDIKSKIHKRDISEFTPSRIYDRLNEYIIGQDTAKKILSVALYNHKKRLNDTTGLVNKSNILIAGPSGSGKTLLARTLADIIDVPFAMADATSLTEAGYVGDDVESIIIKLIMAADGDISKAQEGIVYIDEIDKIAGTGAGTKAGNRNPSSDGVQFALLKLIEGSSIAISQPGSNPLLQKKIIFNTSKVLFICGGAFEGIFDRSEKKSIGFNTALSVSEKSKEINTDNLRNFGMKSEFIGRLPIHVQLNELTKEDLVRILSEPKNSIVSEYKALFQQDGIELEITDDALDMIADTAIKTKVGARGIRTIMEDVLMDIMFDAPNHHEYRKIVVSEATVQNKIPQIITTRICNQM